jgi:hypothetical protein
MAHQSLPSESTARGILRIGFLDMGKVIFWKIKN